MQIKPRSLCVHDGVFHGDEVTAAALLILFGLIDQDKIIRTRDPKLLETCEFVCDVGGLYDPERKRFDHHQSEYTGELSSAGMIAEYLKKNSIVSESLYHYLNDALILGVDAHDNGRSPQIVGLCTFSHVIAGFNPVNYEATEEEQNQAFQEAVTFACKQLSHLCERFYYNGTCQKVVKEAMEKGHYVLQFDTPIAWFDSFFALGGEKHSALFIIMPTKEGYKLRAIPPDMVRRMQVRVPLPQEWAGLLGDDLKRVSKIPGAIFCHKGRFTSVWKSKEDALQALKIVLKMNGINYENNL